jgi:hypothetical protein
MGWRARLSFMAAALDALTARAPALIRDGHNKALSSGLAPDGRTEILRALNWQVLPSTDDGFVLPDCVALGVDGEAGLKPLILADLDKVTAVLMPLATERLLVGARKSAPVPPVTTEHVLFDGRSLSRTHVASTFGVSVSGLYTARR